jgi:hypothetical protein
MGAAIGSAIGAGFYEAVLTFKPEFEKTFSEIWAAANKKPGETTKPTEDLATQLSKSLTIGEQVNLSIGTAMMKAVSIAEEAITGKKGPEVDINKSYALTAMATAGQGTGPVADWLGTIGLGKGNFNKDIVKKIQDIIDAALTEGPTAGVAATPVQKMVENETKNLATIAAKAATGMVADAIDQIKSGGTNAVQNYLTAQSAASALAMSAAGMVTASQMAGNLGLNASPISGPQAVNFASNATPDEMKIMAQLTTEVMDTITQINAFSKQGVYSEEDVQTVEELRKKLVGSVKAMSDIYAATQHAISMREVQTQLLPVITMDTMTGEQEQAVLDQAMAFWQDYLTKSGIPLDLQDQWIADQKEQLVQMGDKLTKESTKIPQEYINKATTKLGVGSANKFNFMDVRDQLTSSQMPAMLQRYAQYVTAFKTNFPSYNVETEPVGLILKDGFKTLDINTTLFNLAMQDLIKVEKDKGINGIFNLPEGATFYLPLSAFELDRQTRAGSGNGGSYLDPASSVAGYAADAAALARASNNPLPGTQAETNFRQKQYVSGQMFGIDSDALWGLVTKYAGSPNMKIGQAGSDMNFGKAGGMTISELQDSLISAGFSRPKNDPVVAAVTTTNGLMQSIVTNTTDANILLGLINTAVTGTPQGTSGGYQYMRPDAGVNTTQPDTSLAGKFGTFFDKLGQFLQFGSLFGDQGIFKGTPPALGPGANNTQSAQTIGFNLGINSTTQLMVDGRILADIIKPYLFNDLIKAQPGSGGTVTVNVI